jgi:alpha(1,3/1,4) fucosyltransferase
MRPCIVRAVGAFVRDRIKLDFADFWPGFVKTDNYFTNLLARRFDVEINDDPDVLIYSGYGRTFRRYRCLRIFYTGENRAADFSECDFAFTSDHIDHPDHYRLPHYVIRFAADRFVKPAIDPSVILRAKTGFCSFVVSNPAGRTRNRLFESLSRRKRVDSGGRFANNVGGPVDDKLAFVARYKFNLAFENSSFPGYVTEKIFEPMLVHSVPIYWGDPDANRDFDPRAFVSYHDFPSEEALIDHILELDRDDDAYARMLAAPWFRDGKPPAFIDPEHTLDRLSSMIRSGRRPIASQFPTPRWMGRRLSGWWARRRRRKDRVR